MSLNNLDVVWATKPERAKCRVDLLAGSQEVLSSLGSKGASKQPVLPYQSPS